VPVTMTTMLCTAMTSITDLAVSRHPSKGAAELPPFEEAPHTTSTSKESFASPPFE
jgi:hypothetical protein